MGFYNPYSKDIDWGGGISDFKNKASMILMALMAGGMMPGMGGAKTTEGGTATARGIK
jgi:hypothetical protein